MNVLSQTKILLITGLVTACGATPQSNSESKIYGGKKVKAGEWMSTVALTDESGLFCSGTALNKDLVVTAAHCIEGEQASKIRVYVGSGADGGDVVGQYAVKSAATSPLYDSSNEDSDYDVAYLLLKKPLDLPASAYIPAAVDPEEISELVVRGKSSRIVGYGDRENQNYGTKYEASTTITEVGETEVSIGGKGKDSCYGDSGGPAFGQLSNGEWRVYGVVSRGGECGEGGIWGLIHANLCWIEDDTGMDLGCRS